METGSVLYQTDVLLQPYRCIIIINMNINTIYSIQQLSVPSTGCKMSLVYSISFLSQELSCHQDHPTFKMKTMTVTCCMSLLTKDHTYMGYSNQDSFKINYQGELTAT